MSELAASASDPQDVRPIVSTGGSGKWGPWIFGGVLLVGGAMLFSALSASEDAADAPSVLLPEPGSSAQITSPLPLQTPERLGAPIPNQTTPRGLAPAPQPRIVQPFVPRIVEPEPSSRHSPSQFQPEQQVDARSNRPEVVFEASSRSLRPIQAEPENTRESRVSASRLRNPSRTIPQGTVIPAVLETALDSTRPGGVRALVQRDVSGFDGRRVLIPRGSRLYGQYESSLQPGQKRALVQWIRLIRPDGVTIALDSPSSDPLGRAGIEGKVDGKFWQRFGGALLNSVLDVGVGLAVNQATDGVIVALPGSTQNVQVADTQSIQPTLKVKHGTSVSVFVARDLDFSSVDP